MIDMPTDPHPDAALLALGRELEAAIAEEEATPTSQPEALERAFEREWAAINAIGAMDAHTEAGRQVIALAVARAHLDRAYADDDGAAPDERALAAMVRAFFPGRKKAA